MLTNPDFSSDSEFDDSISLTSYDSETFSQIEAEREARNQELQEQVIAKSIRIAELEAALAAQSLEANAAPKSPSDPLVLAAIQRAEATERQLVEERHIRETAEKTASDAREKLARFEAQQALAAAQAVATQQAAQEAAQQQALLVQQRQAVAAQQATAHQTKLAVAKKKGII